MIDFTNTCNNQMTADSVIRLYARLDSIYRNIIEQLVDVENPEIAAFLKENMPTLTDYLIEAAICEDPSPICEPLEVDMEELFDTCKFFDLYPHEYFIIPEEMDLFDPEDGNV